MAVEIDNKKLDKMVAEVKRSPGNSERFYSEKTGIPMNQVLRYIVLAELKADPSLKIPATGKAIAKARETGLRWPRIAARTGLSESKAKELFSTETGKDPRESYTGRGRNFSGTPSAGASSGRRSNPKKTTAASTRGGTSGRRGAATKKTSAASSAPRGRRGTRAAASDPK